MKILKNIIARLLAAWALLWFIITMLLFFIPFCVCFFWKEPKRSHVSYPLFRVWMKVFLPLAGISIKIKGKENFKPGKNYIVVCNHTSLIDIPVSSTQIQGPNKTIGKIEFSRFPIFGIVYKLGSVLVDRKDKDSRRNSFTKMKWVLENG